MVRSLDGIDAIDGIAGPTTIFPNDSFPRTLNVLRRYRSASMDNISPSPKGPTRISTRSAGGNNTSVASTGASMRPPSVPMMRNGLPPRERRT